MMRVIVSRAFKRRWRGKQHCRQVYGQKEQAEHLVLPGMGLFVLAQMHGAHLRKRTLTFGAGRAFIGRDRPVEIFVRTKNDVAEYKRAPRYGRSVEDDGVVSDFATGPGQQEGCSDH